ncbi:MAG: peptidylprolyl isomerase [Clostridium sp.]|uniref:peptidylprolyl isomerase n=1 Tax=Clostridium sp. TaxID=1506 RepID=UPI002FC755AA
MKKKLIISLFILSFMSMILVGCKTQTKEPTNTPEDNKNLYLSKETEKKPTDQNPVVKIQLEDDSIIKIELYPDIAPNTVRNFITLANDKFYDGLIFHRVIPGFMIQGGDPAGNGSGGPDYSIYGEFSKNNFENSILHERGVISMARAKDKNSGGSQFFIMHEDSPHLDGDYAGFGKVIEGIDIVDKIAASETKSDKPLTDIKIKTITVDTFGVKYNAPTKYTK